MSLKTFRLLQKKKKKAMAMEHDIFYSCTKAQKHTPQTAVIIYEACSNILEKDGARQEISHNGMMSIDESD